MKTNQIPNISWTKLQGTLDDEQVSEVVRLGLPHFNGKVCKDYEKNVYEPTGVNYNRGWLLIFQAWAQQNAPELLVQIDEAGAQKRQAAIVAQLQKELKTTSDPDRIQQLIAAATYDRVRHAIAPEVTALRKQEVSWGEISARLNVPESTCRKAWDSTNPAKSRGLRIGRGGRWAYADPTLYLENRKAEGAQIPVDYKGRPKVEDLLNYHPKDDAKLSGNKAAQKGKAISTIVKLQNLRDDKATPKEQHEAIDEKIADLMNKYDITVAEVTAWKANRDRKGRKAS